MPSRLTAAVIVDGQSSFDPWHDSTKRGRLANEVPFRPDLRLACVAELEDRLGLPRLPASAHIARQVLLANLVYAAARSPDTCVFYSRDRNFYADQPDSRATATFFKLSAMTAAVQSLEDPGLIAHWRTAPSPWAEFRSRIRATETLVSRLGPIQAADFIFEPNRVVVLRDTNGRSVDFLESRDLGRIRRDVEAQNRYLTGFDIRVQHPTARYDDRGFLYVGNRWLNPYRRAYHRVFNIDFSHGGRWYGPFWQGLPSKVRPGLVIDGKPTVEVDFRACHPRLLCARVGLDLPYEDPGFDFYGGDGDARKQIKLAFNIALNAANPQSGLAAIAQRFFKEDWGKGQRAAFPLARDTLDQISRRYPALAGLINTGIGLRLQNHDARICTRVQRHFRDHEVPCLSIHDSFVVPSHCKITLQEVMEQEMQNELRFIRPLTNQ